METFSAYQHAAARTGGSDLKPENRDKGLNCAAMGLAGEAGEVCDLVKKVQHFRAPLDEAKLRKELGDVLWYLAHACNVMGWNLEDIAQMNVEKLRARYPSGFSTADSIARRDEVRSWVREDSHGAVEVTVKIPGELTEAPATPRVEHNGIAVDDVVTLDDEDFRVTVSDEFGWQGVTVATTPSGRPLANVHCDWDDVERVGDRAWRTLPKRERLRTDLTEGAPASKGAKKAAKRAPKAVAAPKPPVVPELPQGDEGVICNGYEGDSGCGSCGANANHSDADPANHAPDCARLAARVLAAKIRGRKGGE